MLLYTRWMSILEFQNKNHFCSGFFFSRTRRVPFFCCCCCSFSFSHSLYFLTHFEFRFVLFTNKLHAIHNVHFDCKSTVVAFVRIHLCVRARYSQCCSLSLSVCVCVPGLAFNGVHCRFQLVCLCTIYAIYMGVEICERWVFRLACNLWLYNQYFSSFISCGFWLFAFCSLSM